MKTLMVQSIFCGLALQQEGPKKNSPSRTKTFTIPETNISPPKRLSQVRKFHKLVSPEGQKGLFNTSRSVTNVTITYIKRRPGTNAKPQEGINFGIHKASLLCDVRLRQLPSQQEDVEIGGHDDHQRAQGIHSEDRQPVTQRVTLVHRC